MDEAVIKYYRRLLRTGFPHAGSIENPSIFADSARGKFRLCGRANDYMHLYLRVQDETISDMKYLCTCGPAGNVAVEILCSIAAGRSLTEIEAVTVGSFCEALGNESEELREKAKGLLELLNAGLARYRAKDGQPASATDVGTRRGYPASLN
jgi:NifU-like protein involved in Fe-S cluster formation